MEMSFYLLIAFISTVFPEINHSVFEDQIIYQNSEKVLQINFLEEPEVFTDSFQLDNQKVDVAISMANTGSGAFASFELKLGTLKNSIEQEKEEFLKGFVSSIMYDLGTEVEQFNSYSYESYSGIDFIISVPKSNPVDDKLAKGRALIIGDVAYMWFAMVEGNNSEKEVGHFLNSFSVKNGE